ncbi:MAG: UvrD-helicase domain-containing protein [Candidatus Pacebacteria bacterium]|nr:UvrD-helicase domain-containing protein [Candidatus Paceibacterota bacterium]
MKNELNEKQLEAVQLINGPLLILAGAGAGKTKTITERVINIIKSGVEPENILCVTFTNKAAKEMLERIIKRMEEEGLIEKYDLEKNNFFRNKKLPTIKTFHSLGLLILKEFGKDLGFHKNMVVLDPSDTNQMVKSIIVSIGLDPKVHDPSKIKNAISREKSNWQSVEDYGKRIVSYNMEIIEKVWKLYELELRKQGSADFDDLIIKSVELLKGNKNVKEFLKNKWKYIHVDEYQDTNNSQYEFIRELVNENTQNICVVGDIDQNIYSWRGANLKNILHFEKDFEGAKVILLEENYRSTQNILKLANISIQKNKARFPKNLFTNKVGEEKIEVCPTFDEKAESEFISYKIKELNKKGVEYKDIAILFRTNFQSRILEEAMIKNTISYNLLGTKFFDRREIKDVLSYLRSSQNRNNLADLKRVFETPKKGIGKTTIAKIFANDEKSLPASAILKIQNVYNFLDKIQSDLILGEKRLSEILQMIIIDSGIEEELLNGGSEEKERLENIRELVSITKKFDEIKTLEALDIFLEDTSLRSDQDDEDKEKNGVRLMTIHASKGLEFEHVFLVGLEQDLFPHIDIGNRKKTLEESEEERRLFYVAVTRAKRKLFLCYAEMRTIYGEKKINLPSEFLEDVNELKESQVEYRELYYSNDIENSFKNKRKAWDFADDDWEDEDVVSF